MSHEAEAIRGKRAQEILEDPVYSEAYEGIRAEIITQWEAARSSADREQLHTMLGLLGKVNTAMSAVMRSGQIASAALTRKAGLLERMKRPFAA